MASAPRAPRSVRPWSRRSRTLGILVYPSLVMGVLFIPVLGLGPLAFAIRRDIDLSPADIGSAFLGFFLCSALFMPVGGWIASRFAVTAVVRIALSCSTLLCLVLGFAPNKIVVFGTCLVAGTVSGLAMASLNLVITTVVPLRRRGLAFGLKVGAVPAASTFAAVAAVGGAKWGIDWRYFYWTCAAGGAAVAVLSRRVRAETPIRVAKGPGVRRWQRPARSLELLGLGGLFAALGAAVLPGFLVDGLIGHGMSPGGAAGVFTVSGLVGLGCRIVLGALSDRLLRPRVHLCAAAAALVASGVGMVGLAVGGSNIVLVAAALLAFGVGWSWSGLVHYAALLAHADHPAWATSYMQTSTAMGSLLGPFFFGLIAEHGSFALAWAVAAGAVVVGASFILGAVRVLGHQRPHPTSRTR